MFTLYSLVYMLFCTDSSMFVSRLGATVIKRSQVDGVISEKDELLVSESLNLLSHGRTKDNEVISVMWLDLPRQSLSMHKAKAPCITYCCNVLFADIKC